MESNDRKTIQINTELFNRLQNYCDQENIRFRDFVEESLENAPNQEESLKVASEAAKTLEEIEWKRKISYRRGFWQGFFVGFWAAQGKLGLSLHATPDELSLKNEIFKSVWGDQLDLFDSPPEETE